MPANNSEVTHTSGSCEISLTPTTPDILPEALSNTLPAKLDDPSLNWDELDDLLQVSPVTVSDKTVNYVILISIFFFLG